LLRIAALKWSCIKINILFLFLFPLQIQNQISIVQAIVYFVAAIVPIYLYFILNRQDNSHNNKHFQNLLIVLAGFVIVQGIYHFVGGVGFNQLAKGILEPISFVILLIFSIIYFVTNRSKAKKEDVKAQ
jgi:preprotein translocase subunit YajC